MNRYAILSMMFLVPNVYTVAGCSGDADTDTDADSDTDTDTDTDEETCDTADAASWDTADCGPRNNEFVPGSFAVAVAEFAIDDQGNAVGFTGFDSSGSPVQAQVALSVLFLEDGATVLNNDTSCQITIGVDGPVAPDNTWAPAAGVYWGFTLPAGSPVVGDDCALKQFPAEWGGDVAAVVQTWDWGFALNVMDPAVESQLETAFGAQWTAIENSVVGAGYYSNLLQVGGVDPNGYADGGFALASEVDATFTLQTDGSGQPILLPSTDVWFSGATSPGVGAYTGQGVIFIQPADALLAAPQ